MLLFLCVAGFIGLTWYLYFRGSPAYITFPNQWRFRQLNSWESTTIYREIVDERTYLKHGITIKDGDTVFDVGANIGLFSAHMCAEAKNLRIFAFEPVPPTFEAMDENLTSICKPVAAEVHTFKAAVGREKGSVVFTCDPFLTVGASSYDTLSPWVKDALTNIRPTTAALVEFRATQGFAWFWNAVLAALNVPVLGSLVLVLLILQQIYTFSCAAVRKKLYQFTVKVDVISLADVIEKHKVSKIDLLKVDVEGAEFEVLKGIPAAVWPAVRQAVIEVHDFEGKQKAAVRKFLEERGFDIVDAYQEKIFSIMQMGVFYCTRPEGKK